MANKDSEQQFRDAVELLSMLETLAEGLMSKKSSDDGNCSPPWRGIMLTLRQARGSILCGLDSLYSEYSGHSGHSGHSVVSSSGVRSSGAASRQSGTVRSSSVLHGDSGSGTTVDLDRRRAAPLHLDSSRVQSDLSRADLPRASSLSALASRIQKAPTTVGQVRDLVDSYVDDEREVSPA